MEDIEIIKDFIESDGIYAIYHASHADKITKAIENILNRLEQLKRLEELEDNAWRMIADCDINIKKAREKGNAEVEMFYEEKKSIIQKIIS